MDSGTLALTVHLHDDQLNVGAQDITLVFQEIVSAPSMSQIKLTLENPSFSTYRYKSVQKSFSLGLYFNPIQCGIICHLFRPKLIDDLNDTLSDFTLCIERGRPNVWRENDVG